MYNTSSFFIILFSVLMWQCESGPLPKATPSGSERHSYIVRQALPAFQQTFNLKNDFAPRHLLLSSDSGLVLTCVDCVMDGAFDLVGTMDFNTNLINDFVAELSSKASPVISQVTSAVAGLEGKITSAAVDVAHKLTSAVGPALPAVTSAGGAFVDGLKDIFGIKAPAKREFTSEKLQEIVNGIKVQVAQKRAIKSKFQFELATGDQAVNFAFPAPLPINVGLKGSALDSPQAFEIPFAPSFELSVLFKPLVIRMSASVAPKVNATIPFGADFSLSTPMELGLTSVKGESPEVTSRLDTIKVNTIDPNLCLSIAIGPAFGIRLKHLPSNSQANFTVSFELPRISVCIDKNENVNAACKAEPGPIFQNSLHLNSTLDVGVVLEAGLEVLGTDVPIPGLDAVGVPSLTKSFPLVDKCFSLDDV